MITHYVLFYDVVETFAARRAPFREEHLRLVRLARERGEIVMAGALGDPPDGAMLVFRAESAAPAEAFARRDPYVTNGVVTAWQVRPWTVVVGP
jgi:uncharacterized protein YciI